MGKRSKKVKRTLTYEERKAIAQDILENGLMLKQVAAKWSINLGYAYQIFYEFLEWRVGWKHKLSVDEMKNEENGNV